VILPNSAEDSSVTAHVGNLI